MFSCGNFGAVVQWDCNLVAICFKPRLRITLAHLNDFMVTSFRSFVRAVLENSVLIAFCLDIDKYRSPLKTNADDH
jgi:hypothetical protein